LQGTSRDAQGDFEAGDISPPTTKGYMGVVFDDDMEMIKSAEEARSAAELHRVTMEQSGLVLDEKRLEVEKKRSDDEREEREYRRDLGHRRLAIQKNRLDFDEKRMQMEVEERSALVSLYGRTERWLVSFGFTKGEEDFILVSRSALAGLFRAPRIRGYQVYQPPVTLNRRHQCR
jgi:hypothetical protein